MWDYIKKILDNRFKNPFYGNLFLAWIITNWKIIYVTLFVSEEYILKAAGYCTTKIDYILSKYFEAGKEYYFKCIWMDKYCIWMDKYYWNLYLLPIMSALIIQFIMPFILMVFDHLQYCIQKIKENKEKKRGEKENTYLEAENKRLNKENTELKEKNTNLAENKRLKKENTELKKENTELKEENTELKEENTNLATENKRLKGQEIRKIILECMIETDAFKDEEIQNLLYLKNKKHLGIGIFSRDQKNKLLPFIKNKIISAQKKDTHTYVTGGEATGYLLNYQYQFDGIEKIDTEKIIKEYLEQYK